MRHRLTALRWLGAGAVLLAGLGVGCKSHRLKQCCEPCTSCVEPPKAAPAPGKAVTQLPGSELHVPAPRPVPLTVDSTIRNERYNPASRLPSSVTTSEKPVIDEPMMRPVVPTPTIEGNPPVRPGRDTDSVSRPAGPESYVVAERGHSPNYEWLVGELHYIASKDQWRLRYAAIDQEDKYGGAVTLKGGRQWLNTMRHGMMVRVEGRLADADSRDPSPDYLVRDISTLNR